MIDFYSNTRSVLDRYNQIQDKIKTSYDETTDEEDEFNTNLPLYLAHGLLKDASDSPYAQEELVKMANIIIAALQGGTKYGPK